MKLHSIVFPSDWRLSKIKDIAVTRSGGTPSRSLLERYYHNGIYPWVKTMDLNNGFIVQTNECITQAAIDETNSPLFESGTVLVAMYGGFNQIGRTGLLKIQASINQALTAITVDKDKIWPEYLLYWLNFRVDDWKEFAASSRKDPNITRTDVENFPVVVPPLAEQRAIAAILGTWDEAIDLTRRLIEALKQRKQALMQLLLTGEVRFPGFDEEWEEVRLGDVFRERNESGFDDLPLVSITNKGIVYRDTLDKRDTSSSDKSKYLRILPGDVGYNTMRMWQGVSAVSEIEGIVSPAYTVCIPSDSIVAHYMGYLFKLQKTIHTFWRYSQGLVDDTLSLKFDNFKEIKITLPNREEQQLISDMIVTSDGEIDVVESCLESLQTQKRGLMQKLLTGQVRVKVEGE